MTRRGVPAAHVTLVFGDVMRIRDAIVKSASLASATMPPAPTADTVRTRTRACAAAGPVTSQLNCPVATPVFGIDPAIVVQLVPPSRESSTETGMFVPRLCVHVIGRCPSRVQICPPFGVVTVMRGSSIANGTLLVSVAGPSVHMARISAVAVGGPVTCQSIWPTVAVRLCIGAPSASHEAPPSRESSSLTSAAAPRL